MKTSTAIGILALAIAALAIGWAAEQDVKWTGHPNTNQPMPAQNLDAKPVDGMDLFKDYHRTNDVLQLVNNGTNVIVRINSSLQVLVHGKVVGQITTNSWVPFPVDGVPTFQEGLELGIKTCLRNRDVRDMRALIATAVSLWNESHQPQKP